MGKHAMQEQVTARPRRRDLRRTLHVSDSINADISASTADSANVSEEIIRFSEVNTQQSCSMVSDITDTGETAVIDIVLLKGNTAEERTQEQEEQSVSISGIARMPRMLKTSNRWSDIVRSALHCANSKRAWASVGAGAAVAALIVGSMGINHVTQAQAVAHRSVLNSALMAADSESDSSGVLAQNKQAQARAKAEGRAEAAKNMASDPRAICQGLDTGTSSVANVYRSKDFSPVYYPIRQDRYTISSPFGMRTSPLTGVSEMHTGVDMAGAAGEPMYAIADGVVLTTTYSGVDNGIVIEHRVNGKVFTSWYAHAYADDIFVTEGQEVKAGQKVALRGSSGHSTGPHLHFELHWGAGMKTDAVDPLIALKELGALDIAQDCKIS